MQALKIVLAVAVAIVLTVALTSFADYYTPAPEGMAEAVVLREFPKSEILAHEQPASAPQVFVVCTTVETFEPAFSHKESAATKGEGEDGIVKVLLVESRYNKEARILNKTFVGTPCSLK